AKGYNLVGSDFMEVSGKQYDRIVMNPPFSKGRDIQHVQHAYSLLKPGGRLVAIMSEGAFFQSNKAAENFRAWLDGLGATSERLP
ncbi:TPA: methyltransferase, partial [Pseudomonas aeruginosa]